MPRFYFHIEGGERDRTGTELSSHTEAKCEAARFAGRMMCDQAETFWNEASLAMSVTNEDGLILFMLSVVGIDAPILGTPRITPGSGRS